MEHALKTVLRAVFDDLAESIKPGLYDGWNSDTYDALSEVAYQLRNIDLDYLVKAALEKSREKS